MHFQLFFFTYYYISYVYLKFELQYLFKLPTFNFFALKSFVLTFSTIQFFLKYSNVTIIYIYIYNYNNYILCNDSDDIVSNYNNSIIITILFY